VRTLAVALVALVLAAPAAASEQHPTQAELEGEVMCPVCGTTLDQSDSPAAQQIKRVIARRIAAGDTKSEIKARLVANYGDAILAAPPHHGFGLLAWWLPIAGIVAAGSFALVSTLRAPRGDAAAGVRVLAVLDRLRAERKLPEQADFRAWKAQLFAAYRATEPKEHSWHLPGGIILRVVTNPNPEGGVTYLFDDITERIALESRYNALIHTQGETLDALAEAVVVFGSDGRLKLCNPAFIALWKLSAAAVAENPHIEKISQWCRPLLGDGRPALPRLPRRRVGTPRA